MIGMRRVYTLVLSTAFFLLPAVAHDIEDAIVCDIDGFYIGMDLNASDIKINEACKKMMLINSTFAFPYFRVMSNNVVYDICYDWNKKVRHICVHEGQVDKFATPEGISIGMSYNDVTKKIGKRKVCRILYGIAVRLVYCFLSGKDGNRTCA